MTTIISPFIFSFGIACCILGILSPELGIWQSGPPSIDSLQLGGVGLLLVAIGALRGVPQNISPSGLALGLVVLFLSDWLSRGYNLMQGPSIRGEIILCSLLFLFILHLRATRILYVLPILTIFLLCWSFFEASGGRLLFSDDHATFFYRLTLLKENFPLIPFYNPLWNAGTDARDFFATGALNFFLLCSPLIYSFPVEKIYNCLVALICFVLLPGAVYTTARLEKCSLLASTVASVLALTTGLTWYSWGFHFGTMGFITTTALIPPVLALSASVIGDEQISGYRAIALIILFSLMLLWSPSGLVFIPLIALALVRFRSMLKKRFALLIAIALIFINIPWISIFWTASNVSKFVVSEDGGHEAGKPSANVEYKHEASGFNLEESLEVLRETTISTNPLVLLFGLPGIFLLRRNSRLMWIMVCAWLLTLGTIAVPLKPQLEFDRMLVILSIILCIPAGKIIEKLFQSGSDEGNYWLAKILPALVGGFLITGALSTSNFLLNRTPRPYHFAGPIVEHVTHAIKEHNRDGRILFTGHILHELNNGHISPLSYFTQIPMVASSEVHRHWKYRQVFPKSFIARGNKGITEFMDLRNVTAVFAHEREWRDYLYARPDEYKLVWKEERFHLFERIKYQSEYFLSGSGTIEKQDTNSVELQLDSPNAIIKFNYFPFLTSNHCNLSPHKISDEMTLIKLESCPVGETITLKSRLPLSRVLG